MRYVSSLLVVVILLGPGAVGDVAHASEQGTPEQVAYGAGSVVGTLVYAPVKASFCILGAIGGAFTAIASTETASDVVGASCRGTWAITPDALRGKERVRFVGERPGGGNRRETRSMEPATSSTR